MSHFDLCRNLYTFVYIYFLGFVPVSVELKLFDEWSRVPAHVGKLEKALQFFHIVRPKFTILRGKLVNFAHLGEK